MYPVLFRIGDFEVTSFGLMMFLSFLGGAWVLGRMLKKYGFPTDLAWDLLAWIAIGGIIGAKAYYLALHWGDLAANPLREIFSRGGLVWYGGLIGGVTAYYLQIRARKLPLAVMFDATAPALMLSIAIGRIGCFLVGDDYGVSTNGWYGIAFPQGTPPSTAGNLRALGDSIPGNIPDSAILRVHPTQLYEVPIVLVMGAVLWRLAGKRLRPGQLFAIWMGMYAVERFIIEFVRAKGDRVALGLSTSQIMSILLLGVAITLWLRQRDKPFWDPAAAPAQTRGRGRAARSPA
ncbi:MAG: prolipoprotein diacylglyceryl transferase [Longimicrobiales bacterium]